MRLAQPVMERARLISYALIAMDEHTLSATDAMGMGKSYAQTAMGKVVNVALLAMVLEERNASPVQAEAVNAVACVQEQVLDWMEGNVFIAEEVEYKDALSAKGEALNIALFAKVEEEKYVVLATDMAQ